MDPDATLIEIRAVTIKLAGQIRRYGGAVNSDDVLRLLVLIDSLDEWLQFGGFLPADWKHDPDPRMDPL